MSAAGTQALKVGTLVSVALVALMISSFFIGEGQNFWERKVDFEIHFSRTNGLLVGAPVALSGVNVGSVIDIDFPTLEQARYITVRIKVTRKVVPWIREDTVATIRTQGMLGDKYVELTSGSPGAPAREPGSVIPEVDPIDYEAVLGRSGDIVSNIVELTASLRNVLQAIDRGEGLLGAIVRSRDAGELTFSDVQEAVSNITTITANIAEITAAVEGGEGVIGSLVRDTPETEHILTRLARAAENLDELSQRLNASRGLVPRLMEDEEAGERIMTNLDSAAENLARTTSKVEGGEGTLGALINDPTLYDESTDLVRSMRRSWVLGIYRGLRGLWPFEGGESAAPPQETTRPGPRPRR
jgi:phospholipid/cholesterol/gamma-HCH transport system substrate-binding protein